MIYKRKSTQMKNVTPYEKYSRLNEDNFPAGNVNIQQAGMETFKFNKPYLLNKSLFKIGKSAIDTAGTEFQNALKVLKPLKGEIIQIIGGASEIGNDKGFDNKALALKRAQHFLDALKAEGVDVARYSPIKGEVIPGTAQKGEKADNAQFVTVTRLKETTTYSTKPAIDNATSRVPNKFINVKPIGTLDSFSMDITYQGGPTNKVRLIDAIKKAAQDNMGSALPKNPFQS